MWLKKRDSSLLIRLIEIYISTQNPTASSQLLPLLAVSDATVRKDLQKLDGYGLLYKLLYKLYKSNLSHGRFPTFRGIKCYLKQVNHNPNEPDKSLSQFLKNILKNNSKSPVPAVGTDTGKLDLEDSTKVYSNSNYPRNTIGNIWVLGPRFTAYPRTNSQVEFFSSYFSKILSNKPMEV
jgi:transcriptional regulator of heat shock response